KDNFYIISIEIVFFSLIQELYVPDSHYSYCFFVFGLISYKLLLILTDNKLSIETFILFFNLESISLLSSKA
ncbi:hypothetical protein, partial [Staphylococcus haemolyticus]|uniref:hypothetical protein n=1 Tax=Staphylococcus haemolyticus TaxID=1283 RepID=UPI003BFA0125